MNHVLKQGSGKEKQAGRFQKQSACISRIQNNDGCGGNPNRYHSQTDDRYGCICSHGFQLATNQNSKIYQGSARWKKKKKLQHSDNIYEVESGHVPDSRNDRRC